MSEENDKLNVLKNTTPCFDTSYVSGTNSRGINFGILTTLFENLDQILAEGSSSKPNTSCNNFDVSKRFSFYSPSKKLVQAESFFSLMDKKDSIPEAMKEDYFWIDIACPTKSDIKILAKVFQIITFRYLASIH